nr:spidroin-1-like [Aegilops tauschii subsp. strangulata]
MAAAECGQGSRGVRRRGAGRAQCGDARWEGEAQVAGGQGPAGNGVALAEDGAGAGGTLAAGKRRWRRDLERAARSEAVGSRHSEEQGLAAMRAWATAAVAASGSGCARGGGRVSAHGRKRSRRACAHRWPKLRPDVGEHAREPSSDHGGVAKRRCRRRGEGRELTVAVGNGQWGAGRRSRMT